MSKPFQSLQKTRKQVTYNESFEQKVSSAKTQNSTQFHNKLQLVLVYITQIILSFL